MNTLELTPEQERIKDLLINNPDQIRELVVDKGGDVPLIWSGIRADFFNEGTRTFQLSYLGHPGGPTFSISIDDIVKVHEKS